MKGDSIKLNRLFIGMTRMAINQVIQHFCADFSRRWIKNQFNNLSAKKNKIGYNS